MELRATSFKRSGTGFLTRKMQPGLPDQDNCQYYQHGGTVYGDAYRHFIKDTIFNRFVAWKKSGLKAAQLPIKSALLQFV
jgi:hypothetical protein